MLRQLVLALYLVMLAACPEEARSSNAKEVGAIGFKLSLPGGVRVDALHYLISGPGTFMRSDSIPVAGNGTTFSAKIDGLPAAKGYTIKLDSKVADREAACTGSASFDVLVGKTTSVAVKLRCPGNKSTSAQDTGNVAVDGSFNFCPVVQCATATPSDYGSAITLQGTGSDQDDGPAALTYKWSATAGTFSDESSTNATLTCPASGGDVSIVFEVNDGECSDKVTLATVHCGACAAGQSCGPAGGAGAGGAGSGGAGATGVCAAGSMSTPGATKATYSRTLTLPVPPAAEFATNSGGDGWDLALSSTRVFNVFHHSTALQVSCHNQKDASACWPNRTISDAGSGFSTSMQPGLYVDPITQRLYVYATRVLTKEGGVVCIDTEAASSIANPFCGFTPLTKPNESAISSYSLLSRPVLIGTRLFAFNYVPGQAPGGTDGTGAQNRLLCFDLKAFAACASQPFTVNLGGSTVVNTSVPSPSPNAVGNQLFVPLTNGANRIACIDVGTMSDCSGAWPITTNTSAWQFGPVLPLLTAAGLATGICVPSGRDDCFTLAGMAIATPPKLWATISPMPQWQGPAVTLGPRIYVTNYNLGNQVQCYDYSTQAGCPGFPKALAQLGGIYTINKDPQRPSCLWVNADNGPKQIQNFDAYGGACGRGVIRVLADQFIEPPDPCRPASYASLQIVAPAPGQYTSGSVAFQSGAGNSLGMADMALDAGGSVDLNGLGLNSASGLPQFLITLVGAAGELGEVKVKLTWSADFDPECVGANTEILACQ